MCPNITEDICSNITNICDHDYNDTSVCANNQELCDLVTPLAINSNKSIWGFLYSCCCAYEVCTESASNGAIIILTIMLCCLGIVGNSVTFVMLQLRFRKNMPNILLKILTVMYSITLVASLFTQTVEYLYCSFSEEAGFLLQAVSISFQKLAMFMSIYTIALVALCRSLSTILPEHLELIWKPSRIAVGLIFIISAGILFFMFSMYNFVVMLVNELYMVLFSVIVEFTIPLLILLPCIVIIVRDIWIQKAHIQSHHHRPSSISMAMENELLTDTKEVTKVLAATVILTITSLVVAIIQLLYLLLKGDAYRTKLMNYAHIAVDLNASSCIFVYLIFRSKFRKAFIKCVHGSNEED